MNDIQKEYVMGIEQMSYDKSAGRLLSCFFIINILNVFIKQNIDLDLTNRYLTVVLGLVYLFFLFRERKQIKRVFLLLTLAELLFAILTITSVLRYPESGKAILKRCFWVLTFCVPLSVIVSRVKNHRVFLEETETAQKIVMILILFSWLLTKRRDGRFSYDNYNMKMGYTLLFPLLYHISKICENKKYLFYTMIEFVIIVTYGSRGPLVCIISFLALFILKKSDLSKRMVLLGLFFFFVLLGVSFYEELLSLMVPIINKLGSRSLNMLVKGRIMQDSGRIGIWLEAWEKILQKPFLGWGLCGELTYMNSYPHNVFLDFMMHFGVIFGGLLSLGLLYFLCKNIVLRKMEDMTLLILLCSGLVPLLISNTYTESPVFWVMVALGSSRKMKFHMGKVYL